MSIAILKAFHAGIPVRLLGDRGSIFEIDLNTRREFYWLASQGVPIRLRYNPTWYPEINHWKMAIFVGQGIVEFGSANWTAFELAPVGHPNNYNDNTTMFTDDPALVEAFKIRFDRIWNDTTPEPQSIGGGPPYLKNWDDACAARKECFAPSSGWRLLGLQCPAARRRGHDQHGRLLLGARRPTPPDLIWGQGPEFNNRLVTEINNERLARSSSSSTG